MQIIWTDRKGASRIVTTGDEEKAIAILSKLKCEATVYANDGKTIIGRVERDDAHISGDWRVKWLWWFERGAQ